MQRRLAVVAIATAIAAVLPASVAGSVAARSFTTRHVIAYFRAETGYRLARVPSASSATLDTLSLGLNPPRSSVRRFGAFQVYVVKANRAKTMRALLGTGKPTRLGIYWQRTQGGFWIALKRYGANVVVSWLPPGLRAAVDARWRRLDAVMRRLH